MGEVAASPILRPELLNPQHLLSGFRCDHVALTDWLQRRALTNQASGASRTYVTATPEGEVLGFYAIAPGVVSGAVAIGAVRRNAPMPVPVFVLGRLAVHEAWTGMGIGAGLLRDAILRTRHAARIAGGRALLCHAIDERARGFYLHHGFKPSPSEPLTLMLPL